MKRTVTFLMALILVMSLALPAFAAETDGPVLTLSADKEAAAPGQTVTVTLTLDQALSGLNNYQFNVLYDAARFELTGSTAGADPTVVSAPRQDERGRGDCVTVSGLSTVGQSVTLAEGTVATLTFTALETAELGDAEFTVVPQALPAYEDLSEVALNLVSDAKVTLVMPGDATLDNKVNYKDALAVYNHVRKVRTLESGAFAAADVNSDGKVNYKDALTVYNYVRKLITTIDAE